LNRTVEDRKSEKSPVVDLQILSYDVVNSTKFRYKITRDLEKKSVLSNSALICGVTYTPEELNSESTLVKIAHNSRFIPSTGLMESTERFMGGFNLWEGVNFWKSVSFTLDDF